MRVLGVGMGPQHVTPEVSAALRTCDYIIAAEKSDDDQLLAVRRSIASAHGLQVVAVPDPPRDRTADYGPAVAHWHEARVAAYAQVLRERAGTAAFLVWGDPSLYDSTLRVVERLARILDLDYDALPGISAPQLLAARHRIVLHEVGHPVHITTSRRLHDDIAAGQGNVVVMLGEPDLDGLDEWSIWWGANLGTDAEELISGRVGSVRPELKAARARAAEAAGWVMDICLLRENP